MVDALIAQWYAAWNAGDADAFAEICAPDVAFRGSTGRAFHTVEGVQAYLAEILTAFPDFHNEVLEVHGGPGVAVARLRYTGTHTGWFRGTDPTGRTIVYEGLARFQAEDGRLTAVTVFGDSAALAAQIGHVDRPSPERARVVPTFRSTDWDRSKAWYRAVGFEVSFEWRHAPGFPVYANVRGHGAVLDISEHSGDCEPGGRVSIQVDDIDALHGELAEAGLEVGPVVNQPWGQRELGLRDPDGNKLLFVAR